jgi:hypothetical protein
MLTHVHKVIHKVVGTFARVFKRKRKVETPSPSCRACKAGFIEETKAKQVTRSDRTRPQGHLHVRSVQAEARAKKLSERTLAAVHRRVRCIFA